MAHSHGHADHSANTPVRTLYICLAINLIFVAAEALAGWMSNSTGLLLLGAVMLIVYESIDNIMNPQEINARTMIIVSSAAILINGLTAWMLMKGQGDDINIKAAYLHAATDMLVSVSVVLSGIIISFTGWVTLDPLLSLVIGIFIGVPT